VGKTSIGNHDASGDGATSEATTWGSNEKVANHEFGLMTTGSIGDFIFLDADGYGKQTGDKGTFEVTMELIQDEKVIATIVIKEDWLYTFDKLPVGEYTVQVDKMHDGSVKVNLGTNRDCVGVDFGFTLAGSIRDVIFLMPTAMAMATMMHLEMVPHVR